MGKVTYIDPGRWSSRRSDHGYIDYKGAVHVGNIPADFRGVVALGPGVYRVGRIAVRGVFTVKDFTLRGSRVTQLTRGDVWFLPRDNVGTTEPELLRLFPHDAPDDDDDDDIGQYMWDTADHSPHD